MRYEKTAADGFRASNRNFADCIRHRVRHYPAFGVLYRGFTDRDRRAGSDRSQRSDDA